METRNHIKNPSGRRGTAIAFNDKRLTNFAWQLHVADSRLRRRHYFADAETEGLKAPGYSFSRLSDGSDDEDSFSTGLTRLFKFAFSKRFSVYHSTLNAHRFEKRLPDLHHHDTILWTIIFWYIEDSKEKHVLMFFYITVQRDGHAELNSAWHLESFVIYTLILGKPIQYFCPKIKICGLCRICVVCVPFSDLVKEFYKIKLAETRALWAERGFCQLSRKKRPVGKKYVSSWKNLFSQLETWNWGVIGFFLKKTWFSL